jgi:ASPM-SPD-2-Hydin domain-containing protein
MRIRFVSFILLLFSSCFGFAQLQVTVFTGVSLGCSKTVIAPNSTIDIGSLQVGTSAPEGFCLVNSGTSTITVTALTVTGADFSATGNVLPLVLQPGAGSPVVIGFTFAPTSAGTKTAQMTLVDDAAGSPQSFTLSGTGFTDFGLNLLVPGTNTQTVTAGQTADYAMIISGAAVPPGPTAFSGVVNFSCSNLPQGASCLFSPGSLSLQPGSESVNVNLAVSTTARPAASLHKPGSKLWYSFAMVFAVLLGATRRRFRMISAVLCFGVLALTISCGGSSKAPPGPTPAGTFPFSVNATSNGVTHSKNMVLAVN